MANTDYQSLLSSASSYRGAGLVNLAQLLRLGLLKSIAANLAPMAATDYQSLLSNANVAQYRSVGLCRESDLIELALLQIIANASGSAAVGTVAPTTAPVSGSNGSLYLNTTDNTLWVYNSVINPTTYWTMLV